MQNTSVTTFQEATPETPAPAPAPGGLRGLVLVHGFGTALATWVVGYIGRMPGMVNEAADGTHTAIIPAEVLFGLLVLVMIVGGMRAAKRSGKLVAGVWTGLIAALLNLIIISSLAGGKNPAEPIAPEAAPWLAAFVLLGGVLGAIGGLIGVKTRNPHTAVPVDPSRHLPAFSRVTAITVLLMLGAGGLVTSARAGLAVPDWPNSEGHFMVFYPLSHMTGGKFYEHAHRLYGVLTGLATAVLGFWILARDPRRWVKGVALLAMLMVIVQATLGGLRVTGNLTTSQNPADLAPSSTLAIVHGVTGQLFFALIVAIAAIISLAWTRTGEQAVSTVGDERAGTDRLFVRILWAAVLLQVALGALLRHVGGGKGVLHSHITLGILVGGFALFIKTRLVAIYKDRSPLLARLGKGLEHLVWTQILLGFVAWAVGGGQGQVADATPATTTLVMATIHQLLGAIVFAWVTLLAVWTLRLLRVASPDTPNTPGTTSPA